MGERDGQGDNENLAGVDHPISGREFTRCQDKSQQAQFPRKGEEGNGNPQDIYISKRDCDGRQAEGRVAETANAKGMEAQGRIKILLYFRTVKGGELHAKLMPFIF